MPPTHIPSPIKRDGIIFKERMNEKKFHKNFPDRWGIYSKEHLHLMWEQHLHVHIITILFSHSSLRGVKVYTQHRIISLWNTKIRRDIHVLDLHLFWGARESSRILIITMKVEKYTCTQFWMGLFWDSHGLSRLKSLALKLCIN